MAQEQPRQANIEEHQPQPQPIKYGDVFLVSEKIANQPVAPRDAAAMQSAESQILGHTQKGGPAAVMQSAATKNLESGAVPRGAATEVGRNHGMTVTESTIDGQRVITESIGDQVVAQYVDPNPNPMREKMVAPPIAMDQQGTVTIGEALEAVAKSAGDKPISQTDAAAIQVAEMQATGRINTPPGGLGAEALSAAAKNKQTMADELKTTLGDILTDARKKMESDKPATVQDAEKVIAAELRNEPQMETSHGGVANSVAIAATLNQQNLKE